MYLFSRKIKCQLCNGNFRGITERGVRKYYCGTYHNYRTCIRYKIDESELITLIVNHLEIQQLKSGVGIRRKKGEKLKVEPQLISNYVKEIIVNPKEESVKIIYVDNTITFVSPTRHVY